MTWTTRPRSEAVSLAVITEGDGQPVLLIHGVGLQAEAWGAQMAALTQSFSVMAVDIPGHGLSQGLPNSAGLADFADSIVAILDRPTVVIGHSFGAMIALDMAIRYPGRVAGVAALNAIYRRSDTAKAAVMARFAGLDGKSVADSGPTLERWFGKAASPARDACRLWLASVDPVGYRNAYLCFAREDGPADYGLQSLRCPALFLTGGAEPNSTPQMSEQMAALAPLGQVQVLADAAHMLPMTHAPQVNKILTRFTAKAFA